MDCDMVAREIVYAVKKKNLKIPAGFLADFSMLQLNSNVHPFRLISSYFDHINMTKNWLEFEQKKFTPTNLNIGT